MIDFAKFEVLTFDCYGTLIDWETGIRDALRPVLDAHGAKIEAEKLLELFGAAESRLEAGPYMRYREVLAECAHAIGAGLGFTPTAEEAARFGASVEHWPAFADSAAALARLKQRFKLAIISNVDDDLFAHSNRKLGVAFDWIVTAQQCGSYKPSLNNFHVAFRKIGVPQARILHVAQSLFHDHVPAKQLGMTTCWIDRRRGKAGAGATPPAEAAPDLTLPDLASLAKLAVP